VISVVATPLLRSKTKEMQRMQWRSFKVTSCMGQELTLSGPGLLEGSKKIEKEEETGVVVGVVAVVPDEEIVQDREARVRVQETEIKTKREPKEKEGESLGMILRSRKKKIEMKTKIGKERETTRIDILVTEGIEIEGTETEVIEIEVTETGATKKKKETRATKKKKETGETKKKKKKETGETKKKKEIGETKKKKETGETKKKKETGETKKKKETGETKKETRETKKETGVTEKERIIKKEIEIGETEIGKEIEIIKEIVLAVQKERETTRTDVQATDPRVPKSEEREPEKETVVLTAIMSMKNLFPKDREYLIRSKLNLNFVNDLKMTLLLLHIE